MIHMREWILPPEEERPVICQCEECGGDIHGGTSTRYGDEHYDFGMLGCVHVDCLRDWARQFLEEG